MGFKSTLSSWLSLEGFARWFVVLFCGSTSVSLLFLFDRSVVQFSPSGVPPVWLQGSSLAAVRLVSQVHASLLLFFALNNFLRLLGLRLAYPALGVSLVLVGRAFLALGSHAPALVEPQLFQSLLVVCFALSVGNFLAQPLLLNVLTLLMLALFSLLIGEFVLAPSHLVSKEALHLTRLMYEYSAAAFFSIAVLFWLQKKLVSSAVFLFLCAIIASRVLVFVQSSAEPHMPLGVAIGTVAACLFGSILNGAAAMVSSERKKEKTKLKQQ